MVELPAGSANAVRFPCVTGLINCCGETPDTTAAGTTEDSTNILSFGGISGIVHNDRAVFLVGVFLTDDEPGDPAPSVTDYTYVCPAGCAVSTIAPEIGQTFFIGLGGESPVYLVPVGATRLFLGIADAFRTHGAPGWYDNNNGKFDVLVRIQ